MSHDVSRHVLDNGLVVVLKETHSAPLISWWVFYRVGSRNEHTGITGATHFVEHMMFKGTEKFPAGKLDKEIERRGGVWNAQTSFDYTAYYETLPASQIDLAMAIEADRMVNALFDPEEFESERTVIVSEREGSENRPFFWLNEIVQGTAFRVHPYHHVILGDMVDIKNITRNELYNHYRRFYCPNNAIIAAVGDFQTDEMLKQIKNLYGSLEPGVTPLPVLREEPEQFGERRVEVERPGNTAFIQAMYRTPPISHEDWFKLAALESIIGGPGGPGGGHIDNHTSRLYKTLIETGIAAGASGNLHMSKDPFSYTLTLVIREGKTLDEAETALDKLIDDLQQKPITQAELDKAKKQARAAFAYSTENVTGQAFWLGYAETLADYTFFTDFVNRLEAVTLADVQDVAQQYLLRSKRTLGRFIPLETN